MEGPMESAPYGPPRVDPSLLRHIPLLSASVMLGEKTPKKSSGIGTPKRDAREETVEIDVSSPPAAAAYHARAAYVARVDQEASRSSARPDGSNGGAEDPWVMDPRSGLWTIGARSGCVQAEHAHSPTPQPAVAGRSPKPAPKHTHAHRAPVPGVARCKQSTHIAQHPSEESQGAAKTRAQTHTPTPRTRARSGWVQAEHAHSPTPLPGVAGRSRNPSPNTHTNTAHPCQEWLGASGAHTQPNTRAWSGGAQPKSEPKHTDPHRAPVPGVAGGKRSTYTAKHPAQEWRGAAET